MDKLYTGNGDRGYTSTISNRYVSKTDIIIELLGTLDELSASLGVAKLAPSSSDVFDDIEAVQKKLVGIMGELAGGKQSVTDACIETVENMIDSYAVEFEGFTLPGVNPLSAQLELSRTIARRAERVAAKAAQTGRVRAVTLKYFNRLSDLLYAMSQTAAKGTKSKPAPTRLSSSDEKTLTLSLAKEIALAVESQAEVLGKRIVTAVLDAGGNLMLLQAMDDAYIASRDIAVKKAYTAVSLKMPSHIALAESRGGALDGLGNSDKLLLLGGGEPLVIGDKIVGAVGVSGGTAEEDIAFAELGAKYLRVRLENY